jgi:hypothetical protein
MARSPPKDIDAELAAKGWQGFRASAGQIGRRGAGLCPVCGRSTFKATALSAIGKT